MSLFRRLPFFLLAYFILVLAANAFSFHYTSTPTQCANMTVEWIGGQAPFTLLLVPVGHLNPETRTIIQKNIPAGNSVSFVLNYPAQSQFVAVLNDASGIGAGGTSTVTTVVSSSDSSCLSTTPSRTKFFLFLPDDIGRCDSIDISWGSQAQDPIDILGLIPGGDSFEIANMSDSSTHFEWTVDVSSGTHLVFVAGDKDGLGTGGSSDIIQISNGSGDGCISDNSPSSTASPAAGGVSSATQAQSGTQTVDSGSRAGASGGSAAVTTIDNAGFTVTVGGSVATDGLGSAITIAGSVQAITTTDNSGSTVIIQGSAGLVTTTSNAGSTVTIEPTSPITTTDSTGSTVTLDNSGTSTSGFLGSGGGTVTGASDGSTRSDSYLGLILGIILGLLALGLVSGAVVFYRHHRHGRDRAYRNPWTGGVSQKGPIPWLTALTRGAHLHSGAGSSVDTLPSVYQTEPFILPLEHEPDVIPPQELPCMCIQPQRPDLTARGSSSLSMRTLIGEGPLARDAFGGALAGMHGPECKESTGTHGRPPSRIPSGRAMPRNGFLPSLNNDLPTRVMRDSEDLSPDPEEIEPNPFDDDVVEIPPTYASVRRASRSNRRESWQPSRVLLVRSSASRRSHGSLLSGGLETEAG